MNLSDDGNSHVSVDDMNDDEDRGLARIEREFRSAFEFLKKYPKSVSIFGSTRLDETNRHYRDARILAAKITKMGFAVITGGGPGIMEAANRGAFEAGGPSLGLSIELPKPQQDNNYLTDRRDFFYFFTRKTALSFAAEAYVFFPGGFGTLDEFFEVLTLVQTGKIPRVPIFLVGSDYWKPLDEYVRKVLCEAHHTVNPEEMSLYVITDDNDEILRVVGKTPVMNWWKLFDDSKPNIDHI